MQPQQLLAYKRLKRQLQHTVYGPPQAAVLCVQTVSSSTICVLVTIAHAHTAIATLIIIQKFTARGFTLRIRISSLIGVVICPQIAPPVATNNKTTTYQK